MNKYKIYMIVSIIILIISIGTSLAWYVWSSTDNALVNIEVCTPKISFIGGETLNGSNIKPILDREKAIKKEIEVYLNKTCQEGDSAVMNLYMTLDLLPTGLQEESFVYEIWKDNEMVVRDNFQNKKQGSTIEILENEIITTSKSKYMVYIYIDGNKVNPLTMGGNSFKFSVYGKGTGAIYEENVIGNYTAPSNSSSVFLNSSLARSSIKSLTIAEDNKVPSTISEENTKDISSKQDGSVMLWYTDEDNDGLYEAYIGSENGVIKANTNMHGMFSYLTNVESLDLTNLDTSNVTNMSKLFYNSSSLKEIKLSNFDTSKATDMNSMFWNLSSLTTLDVSNFNTSNVTNMAYMFGGCKSLTELNVSNFDTSKVISMESMFSYCSKLTSLNLNNFNTIKVTNMSAMFKKCNNLTLLDLSNFDTTKVTNMSSMFMDCKKLTNLDLSNFDTCNVNTMIYMFQGCSKLTNLNISSFNTSNVTSMREMFTGCSSFINLNISNFDTSKVTDMGAMFRGCSSLTNLDLRNFNTLNVKDMAYMFAYCNDLKNIDLRNMKFSNVTNYSNMFINVRNNCEIITNSDGKTWLNENFSYLTNVVVA